MELDPLRHNDFRSILRSELERRCRRNPLYSLRCFARDLGLAPARLSDVLRSRYGLSRMAARDIAGRLGFSTAETSHFCDLVESQHSRNKQLREGARRRLSQADHRYHQLSLDLYQAISDVHHFAILELSGLENFDSSPAWIARQLGISELAAEQALERLLRIGLLKKSEAGLLRAAEDFTMSPDGVPSEAVKSSHRQLLAKAADALDFQPIDERDLTSMIVAIDSSQIREAKEMIKSFRRDFDARFGSSPKKNRVVCLAVQLFSLQETQEHSG